MTPTLPFSLRGLDVWQEDTTSWALETRDGSGPAGFITRNGSALEGRTVCDGYDVALGTFGTFDEAVSAIIRERQH